MCDNDVSPNNYHPLFRGSNGADIGGVISGILTNNNISVMIFCVVVVLPLFWVHTFCFLSLGSIYLND